MDILYSPKPTRNPPACWIADITFSPPFDLGYLSLMSTSELVLLEDLICHQSPSVFSISHIEAFVTRSSTWVLLNVFPCLFLGYLEHGFYICFNGLLLIITFMSVLGHLMDLSPLSFCIKWYCFHVWLFIFLLGTRHCEFYPVESWIFLKYN